MKLYDEVKVSAIRDARFAQRRPVFERHPQVGDVGTIVEMYEGACEVECCLPGTGRTLWLETMFPGELESL